MSTARDAAVGFGLDVAPLSESAQTRLKAALPYASPRNPVDITAQAFNRVELIADNLGIVFEEEQHDAVVAFFTYVAAADGMIEPIRDAIHAARERRPGCALVLSIVAPPDVVRQYEAVGCPVFEDPTRAVRAVAALHRFSRIFAEGADAVIEEGAGGPPDAPPIAPHTASLPEGPLSEREAKRLLSEAGVPVVEEKLARTAGEAARAAAAFDRPVAVKLCAPGLLHKTELGGVVLDVSNEVEARRAYETVTSRARAADPEVRVEGVLIAPMVTGGIETILGVRKDPTFGPVVMFGLGGTLVEVIEDVSFRVAPFGEAEARRMVAETRAGKLLRGTRGRGPYDVAALAAALSRLSVFAAKHGDQIETAEMNPFVVLPEGHGAVALDAVIVTRPVFPSPASSAAAFCDADS